MVKIYFLDTSALVKRYMTETGTAWIENLIEPSNKIILSRITWVETLSAFARLHRENKIIDENALFQTIQLFKTDWESQYQIVEIETADFEKAGELVQKYPLRAYDSIQLASALKIYTAFSQVQITFTFVSADERLINVAQIENLNVENPNHH